MIRTLIFAAGALACAASPASALTECGDRYTSEADVKANIFVYAQGHGASPVWAEHELCKIPQSEVDASPQCNNLGTDERCLQVKKSQMTPNGPKGAPKIMKVGCDQLTPSLREEGAIEARKIFGCPVQASNPLPPPAHLLGHVQGECWPKYSRQETVYYGSYSRIVLCQAPDYTTANKTISKDLHMLAGTWVQHLGDTDCSALTSGEKAVLCGPKY